jgi:tetratricopeptide (TPR) repeat protein
LPEAQRWFNEALVWTFAFNHDEAIRSYREAARLDPECAMAWWGIALCNGPHINFPMVPPERAQAAWEALEQARAHASKASPVERALIDALGHRYANPQPEDRSPLDKAYARAMLEVWINHPRDADIAVLFAESLMDLRPWDLWTKDGKPYPGTEQILATLERAMELNPDHPGALHLYIHAVEASPQAARGLAAADRLLPLVPGSGHLTHMPSHIYVLTGRWPDAITSNERAQATDRAYRSLSPRQGFYRFYMAHNQHMLAFASMMEGRSAEALRAARAMVADIPPEYIKENAVLIDGILSIPLEVMVRFGHWDQVLAEPKPAEYLPVSTTLWHYARGTSFAATGRVEEAEQEARALDDAAQRVSDAALISLNPAKKVIEIARHHLAGEIAVRKGEAAAGVEQLQQAVQLEDALRYIEPPDWIQPVRHTLGAVLLKQGKNEEAELVFREDLRLHPENGWALIGLSRALERRGAQEEAAKVRERFDKAWARADLTIDTSCLCQPGV